MPPETVPYPEARTAWEAYVVPPPPKMPAADLAVSPCFRHLQPAKASPLAPAPPVRTIRMRVTACSPFDPQDVEYYRRHGYEGRKSNAIAAHLLKLPKGTLLRIPGYANDSWVPVDSSGGGVIRRSSRRGIYHIDVKLTSYRDALRWGNQWLDVEVIFKE